MSYDFNSQRLFVRDGLSAGATVVADRSQANYLLNVLRRKSGDEILLFNGRDGEWRARIDATGRRGCVVEAVEQVRPQLPAPDLHYLFAPLKHARLDYLVQKAVEMGAGRLRPVFTRHTQVSRVNVERMEANAIEAAEQCGILGIPAVDAPQPLDAALAEWPADRRLIFCDEAAPTVAPAAVLKELAPGPAALLVGPEGGFAAEERETLRRLPYVVPLSLGPRILRADTAAVAALAVVQSFIGDWR